MDSRIIVQMNFDEMTVASSKLSEAGKSGVNAKGVHIIHGNIEILSEFSKSQGAYYTWGRIIHGNLQYLFPV